MSQLPKMPRGSVSVPNRHAITIDRESLLNDSWESNLQTATRRLKDDARRKGYTITDQEARATAPTATTAASTTSPAGLSHLSPRSTNVSQEASNMGQTTYHSVYSQQGNLRAADAVRPLPAALVEKIQRLEAGDKSLRLERRENGGVYLIETFPVTTNAEGKPNLGPDFSETRVDSVEDAKRRAMGHAPWYDTLLPPSKK